MAAVVVVVVMRVIALDRVVMEVVVLVVDMPEEQQQQGLARCGCVDDNEMLVAMARLTRRMVSTGCEATHLNK